VLTAKIASARLATTIGWMRMVAVGMENGEP
jgi:hypothetical protein